ASQRGWQQWRLQRVSLNVSPAGPSWGNTLMCPGYYRMCLYHFSRWGPGRMSGLLQVRNQPLLALDLLANGCTGLQGVEQVLVGCTGELVNMLQALADLTGRLALLVAGGRDLPVAVITLFDAGAD